MISIIESGMLVPVLGVLAGIIIPLSVFIWLYYEGKGKRETIREIAKNMDDPSKLEDLLGIFEERKKEPISPIINIININNSMALLNRENGQPRQYFPGPITYY